MWNAYKKQLEFKPDSSQLGELYEVERNYWSVHIRNQVSPIIIIIYGIT